MCSEARPKFQRSCRTPGRLTGNLARTTAARISMAPAAISYSKEVGQEGLLRRPAAIDNNIRSCDESCILGAQVESKLTNFLHTTPAANRDFGEELLVDLRILDQCSVDRRGERTWADGVYRNALVCEFQCQSASQSEERRLACRVRRAARQRNPTRR